MEPADSIRRLGFNRWYERQLIEGHAWFISAFVCLIAIAACMEELTFRGSALQALTYLGIVLAASITAVYGMVRYQQILVRAERIGGQATCSKCGTYGRFNLFADCMARCRKCEHQWRLMD